jgi:hypothetical protein
MIRFCPSEFCRPIIWGNGHGDGGWRCWEKPGGNCVRSSLDLHDKLLSHMGQKFGRELRAGEARRLELGQAASEERAPGDVEPVRENDVMKVAHGL